MSIARFGRIDALVHVMGGFAGGQSVADTDDATFEKMLDLNYRAAFFIARAVLPQMRQQGSGRILAVASRQAVEPAAMVGAYSASKAALVSLIRTIALENKDRCISANTVLPGTMDTPGNRAGDPRRTARNGCSRRRSPRCWCTSPRTRARRSPARRSRSTASRCDMLAAQLFVDALAAYGLAGAVVCGRVRHARDSARRSGGGARAASAFD